MNRMKAVFLGLPLVAALTACGGGGGAAGDVATFAVLPSSSTYTVTTCAGGGVAGAVSVHTINGGAAPFRVRGTAELVVGLASASNDFVPALLNADGDLVLNGRDPKFAVRATLACPSDVSVYVFDNFSRSAAVSIKVEEGS